MDDRGYYEKFKVVRNDTGEEITSFRFVMLPHDRHARAALRAYADSVEGENPELARELRERLTQYE